MVRVFLLLPFLLMLPVGASAQSAQDVSRQHFEAGVAFIAQSQWPDAIRELEAARDSYPTASIHFNLGLAYRAVGRGRDAIAAFERFLDAVGERADPARRAEVDRYLTQLRAALAQVTIDVTPAEASVAIDGAPIPRSERVVLLDPGTHTAVVTAPGFAPQTRELTLRPGSREVLQLTLEAERATATLHVRTGIATSEIRVDGVIAGAGDPDLTVPAGLHAVVASAPGYLAVSESVELAAREERTLQLTLTAAGGSVVESPWFWVVTGALLAGAAVAVVWVVTNPSDEAPLAGNLGVARLGLVTF